MMTFSLGLRLLPACMAGALLLSSPTIVAQTAPSAPSSASSAGLLVVQVVSPERPLDPAAVRAAIARELGMRVEPEGASDAPRLTLRISADGKQLDAQFERRDERLERSLRLPDDDQAALEVIALLSGNLVRNEAAELLRELERERERRRELDAAAAPPEAAPPEASAPTPPPESKPATAPPQPSPAPTAAPKPPPAPRALPRRPFNASLVHPIALDPRAPDHAFDVALGLGYSHSGQIRLLALDVLVQRVRQGLRGAGVAGVWNHVNGPVRGVLAAGVASSGTGPLRGLQTASVLTLRQGVVEGAQISGAVAVAARIDGFQTAPMLAYSMGAVRGAQAAGLAFARGPVLGAQLGLVSVGPEVVGGQASLVNATQELLGAQAGLANVSGPVEGAQLGLINVATDTLGGQAGMINVARSLEGAQLGLINVAGPVRGAQVGLVNIAGELNGEQIGLVNLAKNTPVLATAWWEVDDTGGAQGVVGAVFEGGHAYSVLGIGSQLESAADRRHSLIAALGVRFRFGRWLASSDGGVDYGSRDEFERDTSASWRARAFAGYELWPWLDLIAGGGLTQQFEPAVGKETVFGLAGLELFRSL